TVVADRLVGLFGLIWFATAFGGAFWLAGDPAVAANDYLRSIVRVCAGLTAAAVVGWVLLGLLPQRRADRFAGRLGRLPRVGDALAEVWYAVWTYRRRPGAVLAAVALTAAVHVGFVLMFHLAVRVFPGGDPGSLAQHLVVAPVGFIAQAFFPAPGGVGGGEAIFGYLYTLLDRPEGTGGFGRFTLRVAEWCFGFVGYLVYLRMRAELPPVEAVQESGVGGQESERSRQPVFSES
ncbi:MAG: flippase-like domain-containing protein, partial [Gemmataceae bacterium]|nr:flippase-like domain-containing protein [Gemmataceae bacterium]